MSPYLFSNQLTGTSQVRLGLLVLAAVENLKLCTVIDVPGVSGCFYQLPSDLTYLVFVLIIVTEFSE